MSAPALRSFPGFASSNTSRPPVDPILAKPAADPFDVRQVAEFEPDDRGCHFGRGLDIKALEPAPEGAGAVLANILLNDQIRPQLVTYVLSIGHRSGLAFMRPARLGRLRRFRLLPWSGSVSERICGMTDQGHRPFA